MTYLRISNPPLNRFPIRIKTEKDIDKSMYRQIILILLKEKISLEDINVVLNRFGEKEIRFAIKRFKNKKKINYDIFKYIIHYCERYHKNK
jgi:hypothetical protein